MPENTMWARAKTMRSACSTGRQSVSVCSTQGARSDHWHRGGHQTRAGNSQHGLHMDKGLTCRGSVTSAFGSRGSHSALRVGPVDTLCLVCMRNKRNTGMHKDGSHGPLLQLHSRQLALLLEKEQIAVPSVFLTSFHTRPLTRICGVAWTPEECPQRACPQCSQSGFRQHDFRRKHLTPR